MGEQLASKGVTSIPLDKQGQGLSLVDVQLCLVNGHRSQVHQGISRDETMPEHSRGVSAHKGIVVFQVRHLSIEWSIFDWGDTKDVKHVLVF